MELKIFIKQNIKITNEFRYFGLYFYFGNQEKFMLNFYSELFLNVNKILAGADYNNDMDQKTFFLNLKVLNSSISWIIIIPCFHFPLIINEIDKYNHVHSILVHCHGKHVHKEKYFKSFLKYKGLFTTHNELINKLKLINKGYTIPLFNYNFEEKYNYEKYNFSLGPNIKSKIKNNLRNLYENNYLSFDMTYNCNSSKQLIFKAYLYYKDIKEEKKNVNNPEELLFCKDFIDIEDDVPLDKKINLCKEFIPKLYLVCYYYLSYYYSNPFKMPIDEVRENIKSTDENNKSKLYISLGNIINDCYTKIINGESILTKNIVNNFHNILIKIVIIEKGKINISQYLEILSDFDYCLSLLFDIFDEKEDNKIANEIIGQIMSNNRNI